MLFQILKTQPKKYLARLREIIKYLNDNYNKGITLKELSNVFDLTVPYISSFFDKYFGNNFQDYYDELRISKSIPTLLENKLTLDDMAIKFGFTDARGYVRAFKKFIILHQQNIVKVQHQVHKVAFY